MREGTGRATNTHVSLTRSILSCAHYFVAPVTQAHVIRIYSASDDCLNHPQEKGTFQNECPFL